jgi:NAD(P)H-flavin reductase
MDWMILRRASVWAALIFLRLPSAAVIFKPLQFVTVSFPSSIRRFFMTRQ